MSEHPITLADLKQFAELNKAKGNPNGVLDKAIELLEAANAEIAFMRDIEAVDNYKKEIDMLRGQRNASNRMIEQLQDELASIKTNEWREAVIDGLVVGHIYQKVHDNNPRKALNDLICWDVQIALDPLVSEDAQKLKDYIPPKVQRIVMAAAYANFVPDAGGYQEGRAVEDCYEELHEALNDYFTKSDLESPNYDWITEEEFLTRLGKPE